MYNASIERRSSLANSRQVRRIKQGKNAWNALRKEQPELRPDLFEADLHELYLRGANLSEANLGRASLYGADLRGTDL